MNTENPVTRCSLSKSNQRGNNLYENKSDSQLNRPTRCTRMLMRKRTSSQKTDVTLAFLSAQFHLSGNIQEFLTRFLDRTENSMLVLCSKMRNTTRPYYNDFVDFSALD